MSDPRMDPYEAIGYGRFTAAQIQTLLLGLDPELDGALKLMASRVLSVSEALEASILRAGVPQIFLHRAEEGQPDPVHAARNTLRGLVHHAEGLRDGFMITSKILQGESLSTAVRRTPAKLLVRLEHARKAILGMRPMFLEHEQWLKKVGDAVAALEQFDNEVRAARAERRTWTTGAPAGWVAEMSSVWANWQRVYDGARHVVIGVLAGCDKLPLILEVFDDLADESSAQISQFPLPSFAND